MILRDSAEINRKEKDKTIFENPLITSQGGKTNSLNVQGDGLPGFRVQVEKTDFRKN
jgi:hypothetical protein